MSRLEALLKAETQKVRELRRENSDLKDRIKGLEAQVVRLKKLIRPTGDTDPSDLIELIEELENKLKFANAEIKRLKSK